MTLTEKSTPEREDKSFGGIGQREASRRGNEARRQKAKARQQAAEQGAVDGARSFRQRLGVSLSKLTQEELDSVVSRLAKSGNANALARLADQAFGRPSEQDDPHGQGTSATLATLSRDELAVALAGLDALPEAPAPAPVHAPVTKAAPPTPAAGGASGGDFFREPLAADEEA